MKIFRKDVKKHFKKRGSIKIAWKFYLKQLMRINLLQLVIRETNHNDSKNLKRMNYILICMSFIRFACGHEVFLKTKMQQWLKCKERLISSYLLPSKEYGTVNHEMILQKSMGLCAETHTHPRLLQPMFSCCQYN